MKFFIKNTLLILFIISFFSCGRNVKKTTPERKDITETVFATGSLIPEDLYKLTSDENGYITAIFYKENDTIKTDSVFALIENETIKINSESSNKLLGIAQKNISNDAPALNQARENIKIAKEKQQHDSLVFERLKRLNEKKIGSKIELENAQLNYDNSKKTLKTAIETYNLIKQQAEQQLIIQKSQTDINNVLAQKSKIKTPVGGKIYQLLKDKGDYIRKGEVIAQIGSPKDFYAYLSIDENSISKVKINQEVIIQLNTDKSKNYKAIISEIYPSFDTKTQSFYCKAIFLEEIDFKILGTQLQANIIVDHKKNVLVIPSDFLGHGNKVMTENGEVIVETGFISDNWVEIINGIDETTTIQAFVK